MKIFLKVWAQARDLGNQAGDVGQREGTLIENMDSGPLPPETNPGVWQCCKLPRQTLGEEGN